MLSFAEFKRALNFSQPKLEFFENDGNFLAVGTYCLNDGPHVDGAIEEFDVLIAADENYPRSEPVLQEKAGRFPRDIDRHVYSTGTCCTCVWAEWLETSDDTSFAAFCGGPIRDFFLSQLHFEQEGDWPFGERKHGAEGLAESVSRILGFRVTPIQALNHLKALTGGPPKGHWMCVCGSGLKARDCSFEHIEEVRARTDRENLVLLRDSLRSQLRLRRASLTRGSAR